MLLVVQFDAGTVRHYDIKEVHYDTIMTWRKMSGAAKAWISSGGSPCQDLTILNASRQGLGGSRGSLFFEWHRVQVELEKACFDLPIIDLLEDVGSMEDSSRNQISFMTSRMCHSSKFEPCPTNKVLLAKSDLACRILDG